MFYMVFQGGGLFRGFEGRECPPKMRPLLEGSHRLKNLDADVMLVPVSSVKGK